MAKREREREKKNDGTDGRSSKRNNNNNTIKWSGLFLALVCQWCHVLCMLRAWNVPHANRLNSSEIEKKEVFFFGLKGEREHKLSPPTKNRSNIIQYRLIQWEHPTREKKTIWIWIQPTSHLDDYYPKLSHELSYKK